MYTYSADDLYAYIIDQDALTLYKSCCRTSTLDDLSSSLVYGALSWVVCRFTVETAKASSGILKYHTTMTSHKVPNPYIHLTRLLAYFIASLRPAMITASLPRSLQFRSHAGPGRKHWILDVQMRRKRNTLRMRILAGRKAPVKVFMHFRAAESYLRMVRPGLMSEAKPL